MGEQETLGNLIEALRNAIPELRGVLLASDDGLPIAHSVSTEADPDRIAAVASAASSFGRRVGNRLDIGTLGEIFVQSEDGSLYVYSAGPKAVLAVMSRQGANAGLIHLEARATAKEIGELL